MGSLLWHRTCSASLDLPRREMESDPILGQKLTAVSDIELLTDASGGPNRLRQEYKVIDSVDSAEYYPRPQTWHPSRSQSVRPNAIPRDRALTDYTYQTGEELSQTSGPGKKAVQTSS